MKHIIGQVNGVDAMIKGERCCTEILDQIASVRAALNGLGIEILTEHLESCVLDAGRENQSPQAKPRNPDELSSEIRVTMKRFLK